MPLEMGLGDFRTLKGVCNSLLSKNLFVGGSLFWFFVCLLVLLWKLNEFLPFCFTTLPLKLMKIQAASCQMWPTFFFTLYFNVI